jgi:hypothetical protein
MATLETLNEDVLYIICEYVYQISEKSPDPLGIEAIWDMPGQFPSTASGLCGELTAIQSLSMTSKYLRDFSAPWIFRNVAVEGRREEVTETLCLMERNHNLPRNVRYANSTLNYLNSNLQNSASNYSKANPLLAEPSNSTSYSSKKSSHTPPTTLTTASSKLSETCPDSQNSISPSQRNALMISPTYSKKPLSRYQKSVL